MSKILQQVGIIKQGKVRTAGVSVGALAMGNDFPGQVRPPAPKYTLL